MQRLSEEKRFEVLNSIINTTNSYYTIVENLLHWGQEHGKFGGKAKGYEETLTLEHLQVLEPLALNKLRTHLRVEDFEQGSFYFRRLVLVWQELGSVEEVGEWLRNAVDTDEGLLKVLTAFLSPDNRLDPYWFKPFLDPASLRGRVDDLARAEGLSTKQRLAAVEFLQEYADRDAENSPEDLAYFPGKTVFEQMSLNRCCS